MLFYILNIAIILVILLIADWWANQGLFSAILHLLCVIIAGALALAFWEPITVGLLLKGTAFDEFAWGVSLVGVFVFVLVVLRVLLDKLIPANVDLPHWANLIFGFPVGLLAAELTIGLTIIGVGHLPTQREIGAINGWQRDTSGKVVQIEGTPFWSFAPQIASDFYSYLSGGAFSTATPLRWCNPDLYMQATLLRDGYTNSKGELVSRVSMLPEAVEVLEYFRSTERREAAVRLKFSRKAYDGGQQLILSAAQVRLIGAPRDGGDAPYVFPVGFSEQATLASVGYFKFDTAAHYLTSLQGQESSEALIVFPQLPGGAEARYIQIRGTRFSLPPPSKDDLPGGEFEARKFALGSGASQGGATEDRTRPTVNKNEIFIKAEMPIISSKNMLPGGMKTAERGEREEIFEGKADFPKNPERPSTKLLISKIYQQDKTRIVQLDVSRNTTADVFGFVNRENLGNAVAPMLVDKLGYTYRAIGYMHDHGAAVTIRLDRHEGIGSVRELPELSTSGAESLILVFEVTEGVDISAFRLNNLVVANINLSVSAEGVRKQHGEDD